MQDVASALGPDEGLGVGVVVSDVFVDGADQVRHVGEHPAAQPLVGDIAAPVRAAAALETDGGPITLGVDPFVFVVGLSAVALALKPAGSPPDQQARCGCISPDFSITWIFARDEGSAAGP